MGLKNTSGIDLKQYWSDGVKTYLGMQMHGFPNAWTAYTPHGKSCFPPIPIPILLFSLLAFSPKINTLRSPPSFSPTHTDVPQAPTALSNGPTIIEAQTDFIASMISASETKSIKSIQPTVTAQEEWQALINMMNEHTLFPFTNSWWTGGNVSLSSSPPGPSQRINYVLSFVPSRLLS